MLVCFICCVFLGSAEKLHQEFPFEYGTFPYFGNYRGGLPNRGVMDRQTKQPCRGCPSSWGNPLRGSVHQVLLHKGLSQKGKIGAELQPTVGAPRSSAAKAGELSVSPAIGGGSQIPLIIIVCISTIYVRRNF